MRLVTDSVPFAARLFPGAAAGWTPVPPEGAGDHRGLVAGLFEGRPVQATTIPGSWRWPRLYAVASADRSQFDQLVELGRAAADLPDGILCLAGEGRGLHGQRGRPWLALPGNIHLSCWLRPPPQVARTPVALVAMAAVAVVEAIDGLPGLAGHARIKWVNDVLIDDAKVCGILTHLETRADAIRAIVGIGLNVEVAPPVPATPFVPAVTALRTVVDPPEAGGLATVLDGLLSSLGRAYDGLCADGPATVFARYRERSLVLGRQVAICAEEAGPHSRVVAEGRVERLGDQLELYLEGVARPFTTGRLLLRD